MPKPPVNLPRGRVLLVGTGAIGVALIPGWVLYLREAFKWDIRVCLTWSAEQLVSPAALAALSGHPVHGTSTTPDLEGVVRHRELAEWADLVIVAPATGNYIAKLAQGIADSLALTVVAFTDAPIVLVPSLTESVATNPATKRNLRSLHADGFHLVPTADGFSAHDGEAIGGAMPNIIQVIDYLAGHPILERYDEDAAAR